MFQAVKLYEFDGQKRSLKDIAQRTGINRWTLYKRAQVGTDLTRPLYAKCPPAKKERMPVLTGNRDRDLETIVACMHQRIRIRNALKT